MFKDFNFSVPQEQVFGMGSLNKLPDILKIKKSDKVLIISDQGLKSLGVVDKVEKIVTDSGLQVASFLDVEPNPSCETCEKAAEAYRAFGATSMIALGGGSPMDVAKAAAILVSHGGKVQDYEGAGKIPGPVCPMIAIPTTAGTGSETTRFAVITDVARNYKLTAIGAELLPSHAILDPQLIMSLPASIAAPTCIDAFVHAVESYINTAVNPFTAAMGEKAMELIGKYIRRFVANRADEEAASAMMLASNLAGIAFSLGRLGNCHAMAHPLGGFFHVAHGVANAILLPTILEYNALADMGAYEKIYNFIKQDNETDRYFEPKMLIDEIRTLTKDLGIPATLSDVGVTADLIPQMAVDAMKSGNILVNPRQSTQKDIEMLYQRAM